MRKHNCRICFSGDCEFISEIVKCDKTLLEVGEVLLRRFQAINSILQVSSM